MWRNDGSACRSKEKKKGIPFSEERSKENRGKKKERKSEKKERIVDIRCGGCVPDILSLQWRETILENKKVRRNEGEGRNDQTDQGGESGCESGERCA